MQIIHVAGTSGKGSTATLISQFLSAHHFKVGLQLSPHLIDIRERVQINSQLISKKRFILALKKVLRTSVRATYFEILVATALVAFKNQGVQYAVVETGLGGLYDATNAMQGDKIVVITRIGLDHTRILGKTLVEITTQKAGIIQRGSRVIVLDQASEILGPIHERARQVGALVTSIDPRKIVPEFHPTLKGTLLSLQTQNGIWGNLRFNLLGNHQRENLALAFSALQLISERSKDKIQKTHVRKVLDTATLPGRFEIWQRDRRFVILDGAHNPQKTEALSVSIQGIFSDTNVNCIINFSCGKDVEGMLKALLPITINWVATEFKTATRRHFALNKLMQIFSHFRLKALAKPNPSQALEAALTLNFLPIVCTGSLYSIGEYQKKLKNLGFTRVKN